jgi:hypothetical protein
VAAGAVELIRKLALEALHDGYVDEVRHVSRDLRRCLKSGRRGDC